MKNKKKMRKFTEAGKMWLWWQRKHKNNKLLQIIGGKDE